MNPTDLRPHDVDHPVKVNEPVNATTRRLAIMNLAIRSIEADLVDTALRDSALTQSEATPQVLSKAKNNMVALPSQLFGKLGMN